MYFKIIKLKNLNFIKCIELRGIKNGELNLATIQNAKIDDTTLRDGLQMPGIRAPAPHQRLKIASYLNDIGVDRLELFGTWYDVDRKTAQLILDAGFKARVAIWVRANQNDIDEALRLNGITEVGISHPVSDIHLKNKLRITRDEAYERVTSAVQYATEHGLKSFIMVKIVPEQI